VPYLHVGQSVADPCRFPCLIDNDRHQIVHGSHQIARLSRDDRTVQQFATILVLNRAINPSKDEYFSLRMETVGSFRLAVTMPLVLLPPRGPRPGMPHGPKTLFGRQSPGALEIQRDQGASDCRDMSPVSIAEGFFRENTFINDAIDVAHRHPQYDCGLGGRLHFHDAAHDGSPIIASDASE